MGNQISAKSSAPILSKNNLQQWVGAFTYERGAVAFRRGLVLSWQAEPLGEGGVKINGRVHGSRGTAYQTQVEWKGESGFEARCSCAHAYACKHAVALALALIESGRIGASSHNGIAIEEETWTHQLSSLLEAPPAAEPPPSVIRYRLSIAPSPQGHPERFPGQHCLWVQVERLRLRRDGSCGKGQPLPLKGRRHTPPQNPDDLLFDVLQSINLGSSDMPGDSEGVPVPDGFVAKVLHLLAERPNLVDRDDRPLVIRPDQPAQVMLEIDRQESGELHVMARLALDAHDPLPMTDLALVGHPQPWVLVNGRFHPIRGERSIAQLRQLLGRPIRIPHDDTSRFHREFLPRLVQVPDLVVRTDQPLPTLEDTPPLPILTLAERDGRLDAQVTFRYGDSPDVTFQDPRQLIGGQWDGQAVFWRRQPEGEMGRLSELEALGLHAMGNGTFEAQGDQALDFITDGINWLIKQGWRVYGEDKLHHFRVTSASPKIVSRVASREDWFELTTRVQADGEWIDWAKLREAILQKRRYIRLGSGRFAKLPQEWLRRQRQLMDDLEQTGDERGQFKLARFQAPLVADVLAQSDLEEADESWQDFLSRLKTVQDIPEQPIPKGFTGELRPYQRKGLDYLIFLRDFGLHGILADDMGLGKTVQTIALLQANKEAKLPGPNLLVAPTSVVVNWCREIARFAPDLKVVLWHGNVRPDAVDQDTDVVVTSYALLRRDLSVFRQVTWQTLVLDESQAIKNPESLTSKSARQLKARHRLALTGTPIENHLWDLWSHFAFLMPGYLGSARRFKERFLSPIEGGDSESLQQLRRRVAPFMLRRLKSQVAQDLPPRSEIVSYCELGLAQRRLYDQILHGAREQLLRQVAQQGIERSQIAIIEALLRLRQVACDPRLLNLSTAHNLPSAKVELFLELLTEMLAEGHRVLVFSQFVKMLHLLRTHLDQAGISYFYLDGATQDRQNLVDQFNTGNTPVFLISLKAGGSGLNLTGADYVIHFDPWWNPAVEDQATDRTHRIGQTRHVFSYKLIARNTVEERILDLQERKRSLANDLIHAEDFGKRITQEDLHYLLSVSAD